MILRMHFLCTCNGTHAERYISRGKFCYSQMTTHFIKHSWFLPCCSNPISSLSLWKKSVNAITMFVLTTLALLPLIVRWLLLIYRKVQTSQASAYVNREIPDVQAGFRKGRGTRDQIANIHWIIEKATEFQKKSTSALLTMPKPLTVWITINYGKFWKRWEYQTTLSASWEICMHVKIQQLELDMEQQTGS